TAQDSEIASLNKTVKKLERRNKLRTPGLKRLRKVGSARRVESSDEASLGDQEDASKHGRKITDIDADAEVTSIDETQGRNDDLMFDTGVLDEQEVKVEKVVCTAEVTTESATTITAEVTTETKLEEEERLTRQKEEEANIALIESWDNTQAMMDADYQMAQQLQAEEKEQLSIEENSKLFVQLLEARKKHVAEIRAREKRNTPPTQAQQRKLYFIKDMFDKAFKRVNTFVDYKTELVEDDAKVEDDQEKARMKELMNIIPDEEEVIRADGSSKRYSAFIHMLMNFDREDLETLWKLVKAKHGSTRPEDGYERVLWGDLMTMFEPDVESLVRRTLQNEKVLIWKLFDSCGVHFMRLQSMHIFMLVEKRYPLTPATITCMLNKKLQADHWNEICYQLLKLITKQLKKQ
ncbi:hypothetical protein Tco_0184907, partial [Tanacetum coccineum]